MKPDRRSKECKLLSGSENEILFNLLGYNCQSLSSTVVQLFLTDPPRHSQWRKKEAGIMCLVKDFTKRSYFFRLYCLTRQKLVWENELYNSLEYMAPRPWLHTFEAESCMAAFNFADEEEASNFQRVVLQTLQSKREKRHERRSRTLQQTQGYQGSVPNLPSATGPTYSQNGPQINKHSRSTSSGGSGKNKKDSKRKFTKADIGLPQDFRHVSHVGWDPNRGFDGHGEALVDPQLQEFFARAGVSDIQLRDPDTREFIYDFIETHGGMASVKDDVAAPSRAPPVPSRGPPSQPVPVKPSPPPPPPSVSNANIRHVPPPASHQRTAPPPPPPPPASAKIVEPTRNVPAPPPPPPPPPVMSEPPAPPPTNKPNPSLLDPRAALNEAIKSGHNLKHVELEKRASGHSDTRGELMNQIRQGVELKSVEINERPPAQVPLDGLAGALARALAERSRALHNDTDSESESEAEGDSDSEWED